MAATRKGDGHGIEAPFVFVCRGDPAPADWMARHPGWVRFPATLVTRPEPSLVSRPPEAVRDTQPSLVEPGRLGPASRPASQDAPPVRRRRMPPNRLPTGLGSFDTRDAVAAYLRTSDAMEAAALTHLSSASGSSAARKHVPAGHTAGAPDAHKIMSGKEQHGQPPPHYPPIKEEVASEIANALLDPKIQAFLRLLSFEKFGRERDENYRIRFGDFKGHDPITDQDMLHYKPKDMGSKRKHFTAAGAYQIIGGTYEEAVRHRIVNDFSPASQDKIAAYLLYKANALQAIADQNLDQAFKLLNNTWSSLPGGVGIKENLKDAKLRYEQYLFEENNKVANRRL